MATPQADWLTFEGTSFDPDLFLWAWVAALATYGVGDIVTTITLVYFSEVHTEANPVIRQAIMAFGGGGFLALKLLVIYACIGVSIWAGLEQDDSLMFYGPPAALAVIGFYTTLYNLGLLFG